MAQALINGEQFHPVRKQILESLEPLNVRVQTVPGMADMVNGDLAIDALQDVHIEDLLGRDPVDPEPALMQQHIRGKLPRAAPGPDPGLHPPF